MAVLWLRIKALAPAVRNRHASTISYALQWPAGRDAHSVELVAEWSAKRDRSAAVTSLTAAPDAAGDGKSLRPVLGSDEPGM